MASYTVSGTYQAIRPGVTQVRYVTFFLAQPGTLTISGVNTGTNGNGDAARIYLFYASETRLTAANLATFDQPVEITFATPGLYTVAISEEDFTADEAETGRNADDDVPPFDYEITFTEGTAIISPPRDAVVGTDAAETVTGTAFGELIIGHEGNDTINAGDGGDFIDDGAGNDLINAEDGDDVVAVAPAGVDTVNGGAGSDTLLVDFSAATDAVISNSAPTADGVNGGFQGAYETPADGSGVVYAGIERFVVETGSGNDSITTATGDDVISASSGNDTVSAGDGADTIDGGSGDDSLLGGSGADMMIGGAGNDQYEVDDAGDSVTEDADAGEDTVATSLASYALEANVENLTGTSNAGQTLTGNELDNAITGAGGNDSLEGGLGGDTLDGGASADTLEGGDGDDVYIVDNAGDVVTENAGEGGADEVRTSLSDYDLPDNVERIVFTGTDSGTLRGNSGNNNLGGGGANDAFYLQEGGDDTASGGGGRDGFLFGASLTGADSVDGGDGEDVLAVQGDYSAGLTLSASNLINVETLSLLSGGDTRFGDPGGNLYSYNLTSVDANAPAGGRLTVNGAALAAGENLTFSGSAEMDGTLFIYGGRGTDVLTGGAVADVFFFAEGRLTAGDKVDGGGGNDVLVLRGNYSGANSVVLASDTIVNVETVALLSASDTRFFGGGALYSYDVRSRDGNVAAGGTLTVNGARLISTETMIFDGSNETDGSFRVFGGAGADTITGGAGNDLLYGGLGGDVLWGGAGGDTFQYQSAAEASGRGFDTLVGFDRAVDRIDLPGAVSGWTGMVDGALNDSSFDADVAAAVNSSLQSGSAVLFNASAGDFAGRSFAIIDANGDGEYQSGQDYVIEFVAPMTLVTGASDFFI